MIWRLPSPRTGGRETCWVTFPMNPPCAFWQTTSTPNGVRNDIAFVGTLLGTFVDRHPA